MKNYSIRVNRGDVFRWIIAGKTADNNAAGIDGTPDSFSGFDRQLQLQVEKAISRIERSASARYVYGVFGIQRQVEEAKETSPLCPERGTCSGDSDRQQGRSRDVFLSSAGEIILEGTSLRLTGNDISALLKECSRCILLAATIGAETDRLIRKAQISNMSDAVILDFCASSAAEELCSRVYSDLEKEFEEKGFYLTDRFSPGYGDLPLSLQDEICRVLRTDRRLGLTVSAGGMMIPSKSVTAVIGISGRPQPKKISGCAGCRMRETCNFRKAGKTCE